MPNRMHSLHKMWSIATDVARSAVCLCVCLCIGEKDVGLLCKKRLNRSRWRLLADSCGHKIVYRECSPISFTRWRQWTTRFL